MPPATLWLDSSGRLIVDADGKPILCAECPCPCAECPDEYSFSAVVEYRISGQLAERQEWSGTLSRVEGCNYSGNMARDIVYYDSAGVQCGTYSDTVAIAIYRDGDNWKHDARGTLYPAAQLTGQNCPAGSWDSIDKTASDSWQNCNPPTANPWPDPSTSVATFATFEVA